MKLIGAGWDRTGTVSLQTALEKLGYRTYHMIEAMRNFEKGHLDMWSDYMEGKSDMDWEKLLAGYDATAAIPACIHYKEMMEAFPDAKVILTVRDPQAWWNSWSALVQSQESNVDNLRFLPRFRGIDRVVHNVERKFFRIEPGQYVPEDAIAKFNQHNEEVKATVPAERLLVFNVDEGWEPLCKFLGVPVPDEPFPHENKGTENVDKIMFQMMLKDMVKYLLPYLAGIIIVIVVIILLLSR